MFTCAVIEIHDTRLIIYLNRCYTKALPIDFTTEHFQTLANPDKIHADKPTHMYTGGVGRKSARAQSLRTEPLHTQSISQSEHTHTQTHGHTHRQIFLQETFEVQGETSTLR